MSVVLIVGRGNLGDALKAQLLQNADGTMVRVASRSSEDVKLDMSSMESIRSLDVQLEAASIDHVVVCGGSSTFGALANFDVDSWNANLSAKLGSVSQLVLALVKELKVLKDGGSITITTGQSAQTINKMWPGVAVNNAALNAFVQNAGIDLPRGLRLNAVSPCLVKETAEKAGLPLDSTVTAAEVALVFRDLIFGSDTGIVKEAGTQVAFQRKEEGLSKTSNM